MVNFDQEVEEVEVEEIELWLSSGAVGLAVECTSVLYTSAVKCEYIP